MFPILVAASLLRSRRASCYTLVPIIHTRALNDAMTLLFLLALGKKMVRFTICLVTTSRSSKILSFFKKKKILKFGKITSFKRIRTPKNRSVQANYNIAFVNSDR